MVLVFNIHYKTFVKLTEMKLLYLERKMELLRRQLWLSEQEYGRLSVVIGLHMSGKSALVGSVFRDKRYIYVRMNGMAEAMVMDEIAVQVRNLFGRSLPPSAATVRDIFDYIFAEAGNACFTLIVDSVDEVSRRNPVFWNYFASKWKKNRRKTNINLVFTAVNRQAVEEMFESKDSPLYGCMDLRVDMGFFTPSEIKSLLKEEGIAVSGGDLLALYMVTGGCPRFVIEAVSAGAVSRDGIFQYFLSPASSYMGAIKSVVYGVLGRGSDVYVSILQLLSRGIRTQAEIEEKLGMIVGGHLMKLENEYQLIAKARPLLVDKRTRNTVRYYIKNQTVAFWFRYVEGNRPAVDMGDSRAIVSRVLEDFRSYGREVLCRYFYARFLEGADGASVGGDWLPCSSVTSARPAKDRKKSADPVDIVIIEPKRKNATLVAVAMESAGFDTKPLLSRSDALRKSFLYGFTVDRRLFTLNDM